MFTDFVMWLIGGSLPLCISNVVGNEGADRFEVFTSDGKRLTVILTMGYSCLADNTHSWHLEEIFRCNNRITRSGLRRTLEKAAVRDEFIYQIKLLIEQFIKNCGITSSTFADAMMKSIEQMESAFKTERTIYKYVSVECRNIVMERIKAKRPVLSIGLELFAAAKRLAAARIGRDLEMLEAVKKLVEPDISRLG